MAQQHFSLKQTMVRGLSQKTLATKGLRSHKIQLQWVWKSEEQTMEGQGCFTPSDLYVVLVYTWFSQHLHVLLSIKLNRTPLWLLAADCHFWCTFLLQKCECNHPISSNRLDCLFLWREDRQSTQRKTLRAMTRSNRKLEGSEIKTSIHPLPLLKIATLDGWNEIRLASYPAQHWVLFDTYLPSFLLSVPLLLNCHQFWTLY